MKPRSKLFLGLVGFILLVICVQFSDEFSLREKRDADSTAASPIKEVLSDSNKSPPSKPSAKSKPPPPLTLSSKTLSKKTLPVKKSRVPAVAEDNRIVFGKVKISDLKPCISKAFCEVNSITEDPTYEANKEFYLILNRLKKYIDGDEKDINSASAEDDDPSSEESSGSYEHIPHGPPPGRDGYHYPQYPPPPRYPGYRRGKSLKTKNKVKLADGLVEKAGGNGTTTEGGNSTVSVGSQKRRSARLDVQEKQEKSEFVARKTRELNVVDDLAALIKISAEIGQALRSPRRCRTLFKRCEMSYEEIISIFNRTQKVESSDTLPEKRKTLTTAAPAESTSTASAGDKEEKDAGAQGDSGEGNRNKKSRDEFSDEEDVEYITDSDVQPVKTYSLFSPSIHHDNRHPEEILVDEAFKKFENTFPASGAPENLEYIKKELRKSSSKSKKSHSYKDDDEDEEESDESASGSRESVAGFRGGATHRSSEWSDPVEKHKYPSTYPEDEDAAGFDDGASDHGAKKKEPASSEEEEEEDDEGASDEEPAPAGSSIHTRDEEDIPEENPREPHSVEDEPEYEEERPSKKDKKRNKKKPIPKLVEESSEEEQEMPPQDSPFYGHLSHLNGGQGVKVVPQKIPKDKKKQKKKKRRPASQQGEEDEDYEAPQQDYPGNQGGGGGGNSQGGNFYPPGSDPSASANGGGGGFFQSIMSWFSGGNKQSSPSGGGGPSSSSQEQQPQPYGGGGGGGGSPPPSYYGGKPYGGYNKELPTYEDYKPSSSNSKGNRPSRYPSDDSYSSRPGHPPYSPEDEEPEYNHSKPPPSRRRNKSTNKSSRRPQGRVEEDSSEEAEEDDEDETIRRKPSSSSSKNKQSKSGNKSSDNKKTEVKNRVAPPPPVIIVPEGEVDPYSPTQATKVAPPSKKKKPQKNSPSSDEESREETSSEEAERKDPPQHNNKKRRESLNLPSESNRKSNSPQHGGGGSSGSPGGVPSYEKYFNNIFGTVEESQTKMKSSNAEDRENSSLLLSEFDKISSSFATSADKVPDWSEEDNPRKKINVGSLASNGKSSKGKYTVNKNRRHRNNQHQQQYSSGSYEEPTKDAKESSEEEDKKKKKK